MSETGAGLLRWLAQDEQGVGDGSFALAGVVGHATGKPHRSGNTPVEVHAGGTTQLGQVIGHFGDGHSHRQVGLTSVDREQIDMGVVPTNPGTHPLNER